jgi:hypothetical protein
MTKLPFAPLGALLLCLASAAQSAPATTAQRPACGAGLVARVASALGRADAPGLRTACKPMPSAPAKSIVALAYIGTPAGIDGGTDDSADDSADGDYDLDVLTVDAADGTVLAHLHQERAIGSDAIRFTGLDIDSANYRLAPGVRAFGVTVAHRGSSRIAPFGSSELRLFVENDGVLRQVLERLLLAEGGGEWDGRCQGRMGELRRTVAIGQPGAHGFADLVVGTRSRTTLKQARGNACRHVQRAPQIGRVIWRYDGQQYGAARGIGIGGGVPAPAAGAFSYMAANEAFTRGDLAEGKRLLAIGIAARDAWAYYLMAFNYQNGRGMRQDRAEAMTWHRLAAARGHWQSSYDLGAAYENGEGVARSIAEARAWYRLALRQGFPGDGAQEALARLAPPRGIIAD